MNQNFEINFIEKEPMDLSNYTLIEGFPGMGLVGTISAKYLVEKLNFEQIGYIDSNIFAPIIRIHNGLPVYPSRIYVNRKHKIVVLISEQVVPQAYIDRLAKSIVEWVEKKGVSRVISLAGIKAEPEKAGNKKVYGIVSNAESKKLLLAHEVEIIKEGITTGITALILLELEKRNIEAFSLLGNVEIAADYEAAAELIKKLDEIIGLEIDVKPLFKEAKETQKALVEHFKALKNAHTETKKFEDQTPMYT